MKTKKQKKYNNGTKKVLKCPIGLKPFQKEFSKTIPSNQLIKTNQERKKEFVKELTSKFSPSAIKPENNFYDYINYLWLKNVSLKKQQEYIVQVDDFRLTQDKVYHQLNDIILEYIRTHKDKLAINLKNFYNLEIYSQDYQLARAIDLIRGIGVFNQKIQ